MFFWRMEIMISTMRIVCKWPYYLFPTFSKLSIQRLLGGIVNG